jgi:alcohol dehydrogenase YqhD (iron-dependent ADH family)
MMQNFIHRIPTELYFGKGQISHLAELLNRYGKNVLLTYGGGSIKRTGLYDEIMEILKNNGNTVTEMGGIEPNPRVESVQKGAELCRENRIDVILAVGGGSTIDCSKAIACGTFYEGDMWDMVESADHERKALPLIDILTLAATGSEFDNGAVITNLKKNLKLGGAYTYPAASICDPTYTFTVPKSQTAAGSADIMSHIMEGYFTKDGSDVSYALSEGILKSVIRNLPIALKEPDNYEARAELMYDSDLACSGMPEYGDIAGGWPCHAMEHELSAYYDITHGVGLAILHPRWMRYLLEKDPQTAAPAFARFARNVFHITESDDQKAAIMGIEALEKFFFETAGIPSTLHELKIDEENFEVMAENAVRFHGLQNAWIPLNKEDVIRIFEMCL